MDVSGRRPTGCAFCRHAETTIARQAFKLDAVMMENEGLRLRNGELVADNRRLRLELGHPRPALAVMQPADREA